MQGAHIRGVGIHELAIYLVCNKIQIVGLDYVAQLHHLLAGIEIAGGIIGVAYEDSLGTRPDLLLERLYGRQPESFFYGSAYRLDDGSGEGGERLVVGVERLRNYYLVAGVEAGHEGKEHRLRSSGGDQDLVRFQIDSKAGVVPDELLAEADVAVGRAVFQYLTVYVAKCVQTAFRSLDIGLADIEVIYMHALTLGLVGKGHEFAYWRTG